MNTGKVKDVIRDDSHLVHKKFRVRREYDLVGESLRVLPDEVLEEINGSGVVRRELEKRKGVDE